MLPRSPVQGDLQGAPGRDPQVHHQGPDRQGLSRRFPAVSFLLLAGFCLLIPACSGESNGGRKEFDDSTGPPPTEGTIIFYDPKPTLRGKRLPPALLKVTSIAETNAAKDMPMRLDAGTIEDDAPEKRPTEKDVSKEILNRAKQRSGNVISPERFQILWSQLEEAQVFKLPRYRGATPPQDKASISLSSGGRTWILLRPPTDSESFKSLYETWAKAKTIIYLYSR